MQWSNVGETEILIEPTKTRDSSGAKIAVEITPDIKAVLERARAIGNVKSTFVFHTSRGMSTSAIKSAWRRARDRAGVTAPWFRDLRPKPLSDAKHRGVSLEALRDAAAAHASVGTTEGYICVASR